MSAAVGAPVTVMSNAGEGGAWGVALLALYRYLDKGTLTDFLEKIFEGCEKTTVSADDAEIKSFERFMQEYKKGLAVERLAVEVL